MNTYCMVDENGICRGVFDTSLDDFNVPQNFVITSGADKSWIDTKHWDGNAWNEYASPIRTIPRKDFIQRFTDTEQEALVTLAKTNVKAQVFVTFVLAEEEINLDDPRLATSLDLMTTAGVIAAGRKEIILT